LRVWERVRQPHLLFLAGALLDVTACGTLEVRLEDPPTTEPVSTADLSTDAPNIQPMAPTPVSDDDAANLGGTSGQ